MPTPDSLSPWESAPVAHDAPAAAEPVSLDQAFERDGLVALRAAVAAHGDRIGVTHEKLTDLLLIAHELASNAVRHGGGRGRLRLWRAAGTAYCRVQDWGGGLPDAAEAGRQRPKVGAPNGRGLWLVRQLADEVTLESGTGGTTVTAGLRIPGAPDR